jgi:hypothetical protein
MKKSISRLSTSSAHWGHSLALKLLSSSPIDIDTADAWSLDMNDVDRTYGEIDRKSHTREITKYVKRCVIRFDIVTYFTLY